MFLAEYPLQFLDCCRLFCKEKKTFPNNQRNNRYCLGVDQFVATPVLPQVTHDVNLSRSA